MSRANSFQESIMVWVYESSHFGLVEVWETVDAWKRHIELSGLRVAPYDTGWNVYRGNRFEPVGILRPYEVKR